VFWNYFIVLQQGVFIDETSKYGRLLQRVFSKQPLPIFRYIVGVFLK